MSQRMPPPTTSLRPKLPGEQAASDIAAYQFEIPFSAIGLDGSVALGLLILIGIVFLAIRFASRAKGGSKFKHTAQYGQTPKKRQSFTGSSRRQPERFDAKTAKHLPASKVLQGNAWVTDGDTIVINKTQIRLFGIDAPEIDHPFGQKAKWAMVKLCKGHKVKAVVTDVDHYGRTVARCTLPDGRDLSAELVKMGLAIDWPKYSGGKYEHLEVPGVRNRLWLADARQTGKMYLWEQFEYDQRHLQKR
jgi:endonuclease YncB( thermonuclease family)